MSKDLSRRAVLAGSAAVLPVTAIAEPVLCSTAEPDPAFAAIEAYRRADAAFIAHSIYEDELAIKPPPDEGDYRSAEMVEVVDASGCRAHRSCRNGSDYARGTGCNAAIRA